MHAMHVRVSFSGNEETEDLHVGGLWEIKVLENENSLVRFGRDRKSVV